jgi:hypothetical protein
VSQFVTEVSNCEAVATMPTCRPTLPNSFDIRSMFFLKDHERIDSMSYAYRPDDIEAERVAEWERDSEELRQLLSYVYSSPHHTSGDGSPFLPSESGTVFRFRRKSISRFLLHHDSNGMNVIAVEPANYPEEDERHEVPGYECDVDGQSTLYVAQGSRIYPPCVRLWLNLSQDLKYDVERVLGSQRNGAVLRYFTHRVTAPTDLHERVLNALRWYNRSTSNDSPAEVSLVHLACAFETLLGLEQGRDLTSRLTSAVLLLVGNVPRVDSWVTQFYQARCAIVHTGQAQALTFNPSAAHTKPARPDGTAGYRSLTFYGWLVFQVCAAAITTGASVAHRLGLESLLTTNSQRFAEICRLLNGTGTAIERFRAVASLASEVSEFRHIQESALTVPMILGCVKQAVRQLREVAGMSSECVPERDAMASADVANTLDALSRLKRLDEALKSASWQAAGFGEPRSVVAVLVDTAWHYTFMLYFHLERQAATPSAT